VHCTVCILCKACLHVVLAEWSVMVVVVVSCWERYLGKLCGKLCVSVQLKHTTELCGEHNLIKGGGGSSYSTLWCTCARCLRCASPMFVVPRKAVPVLNR